MNSDSNENYNPINYEVNSPNEIESIINPIITYGKGSAIVRMLSYILGEKTFIKAISVSYILEDYSDRNSFKKILTLKIELSKGVPV
jgi:aminopeptidase N